MLFLLLLPLLADEVFAELERLRKPGPEPEPEPEPEAAEPLVEDQAQPEAAEPLVEDQAQPEAAEPLVEDQAELLGLAQPGGPRAVRRAGNGVRRAHR